MTWSYNASLPLDKDMVRFLIGDIDINDQQVQDEAITVLLTNFGSTFLAAASAAESLASKFARVASVTVDGLSVSSGAGRAQLYRSMALRLRAQNGGSGSLGIPVVGGVSISEMDSVKNDTDRNPSQNTVGQHDFPH
jgi:hypothetical protein